MMMMAEVTAFDNLEELARMGSDLSTFVRRAAIEGVTAHEAEKDIWQQVLAMGRQAFGQFLAAQGDGDVSHRQRRDRRSVSPSGEGSNGEVGHALDD